MKQILAIFIKDTRRFWPEVLISLALLAALVVVYPNHWHQQQWIHSSAFGFFAASGGILGVTASCLVGLVPVSWWILIARLIHCDRLIGTTQYWITRPYEWPKLLAAKLLFLTAFIYAPFFIAQCALLREAGFHPLSYLPGLLVNLLCLTAALVLPLIVLATLTTGFGRMTLLLLGTVLVIAAVAIVSNLLPSNTTGSIPDIISGYLASVVIFCGCVAVILVQYASRNRRLAWVLLVAFVIPLCAGAFFDPDQPLMSRYYPPPTANAAPPVQFAYGAAGLNQPSASGTRDNSELELAIPVRESGVAAGDAVAPVALMATIEGPGGAQWRSPWQPIYSSHYLPGDFTDVMRFRMPRDVYDRFKAVPVTLRLTFALARMHQVAETRIALPSGDFSVPGFAVCEPQSWDFQRLGEYSNISCRSAMNQPPLTYITAQWTEGGCAQPPSSDADDLKSSEWAGELDPGLAEFGITSVWDVSFHLPIPQRARSQESSPLSLCPGSPILFTQYKVIARSQSDLAIPYFRLPDLAPGDKFILTYQVK